MKKIELNMAFLELVAPDIVLVSIKNEFVVEAKDILEMKAANLKLVENRDYAIVVDARHYTSITSEARDILTSKSVAKNRKAHAIIVHDLSQRLIGNFYIQFNKPPVPTKIFSNKDEALIWVKKYL